MPCAMSWSPLNAEMEIAVFWMVDVKRSAVTVISERPDSSPVAAAPAASGIAVASVAFAHPDAQRHAVAIKPANRV